MESYWPTKKEIDEDLVIAEIMTNVSKIVFSKTRNESQWKNIRFFQNNLVAEVKKMKVSVEKNLFVFGSANLCQSLMKHNLIGEYRIMINPVTLGKEKSFFNSDLKLQLLKMKVFGNGNVLLHYRCAD